MKISGIIATSQREPLPFSPSDLSGLTMWFDANDLSTITKDGSGNISQWNDKSANASHATGPAGREPLYQASGINGLGTIDYVLPNDIFYVPDPVGIIGSQNRTIFVVCEVAATGFKYFVHFGQDTKPKAFGLIQIGSTFYVTLSGVNISSGFTFGVNTPRIVAAKLDGTLAGHITTYMDGFASTNALTDVVNTTAISVSSFGDVARGNVFPMDGRVGEILVYNSALSDVNHQKAEGYLAHKWGLTANLPAGHPYKIIAP